MIRFYLIGPWSNVGRVALAVQGAEQPEELGREPINSEWLADVRFGAHSGLKSDIAPCPKSAHVWTAPSWQELSSRFAALVGAAMCSACRCGSHDRWP